MWQSFTASTLTSKSKEKQIAPYLIQHDRCEKRSLNNEVSIYHTLTLCSGQIMIKILIYT